MLGQSFDTTTAPFAFIDLEMSGLEPIKNEILEIGIVRVSQPGLEVLEEWSVKVAPERMETADPEALKVIKWSADAWIGAIPLQQAMEQFVAKTSGHVLAGWNVAYDWVFLEVAMQHTSVRSAIHKRILDVQSFAFAHLSGTLPFGKCGLDAVAEQLHITPSGFHQALADARTTFEIYRALVGKKI